MAKIKYPKVINQKESSLETSGYYVHIVGNSLAIFGRDSVTEVTIKHHLPVWASELETDVVKTLVELLTRDDVKVVCDLRMRKESRYVNNSIGRGLEYKTWYWHQKGFIFTWSEGGVKHRTRIYSKDNQHRLANKHIANALGLR
jgi:REP element-mobilizing transposase RayT